MAASLVHLVFVLEGLITSFVEKTHADEGFCHPRKGVPVFKVTLLLLAHSPGMPMLVLQWATPAKKISWCWRFPWILLGSRHCLAPLGIIGSDEVLVLLAQPLEGLLNVLQTVFLSHDLGAEVGVAVHTIPVPRNGLRIKGCYHSKSSHSWYKIPSQSPIWDSHWVGMTSTFGPLVLMPAYEQAG